MHNVRPAPVAPRSPFLLAWSERLGLRLSRLQHSDSFAGMVLLLAALLALIWANSNWADSYHALWHTSFSVGLGPWTLSQPLHFWVNDALMSLFFLVVGMEIRKELHDGALASPRQALLPAVAALGGVVAPALIFLGLNSTPALRQGWAVPTATDIAFAVGVLALLGRGLPSGLRIFLLALAIIDDLVAVLIIALFYSAGLQWDYLLLSAAALGLVFFMQALGIRRAWAYTLPGALLWWGIWQAGAHPSLAGVVLGLITPVHLLAGRETAAPVERVRSHMHPWVAFGVMPLFALANAGVALQADAAGQAGQATLLWGIVLALVLGKPAGIVLSCWLAVRLRLCALPAGLDWGAVLLAGMLAGIGFTMAIFIANLAFDQAGLLDAAKQGVLLASALAAVLSVVWAFVYRRRSAA